MRFSRTTCRCRADRARSAGLRAVHRAAAPRTRPRPCRPGRGDVHLEHRPSCCRGWLVRRWPVRPGSTYTRARSRPWSTSGSRRRHSPCCCGPTARCGYRRRRQACSPRRSRRWVTCAPSLSVSPAAGRRPSVARSRSWVPRWPPRQVTDEQGDDASPALCRHQVKVHVAAASTRADESPKRNPLRERHRSVGCSSGGVPQDPPDEDSRRGPACGTDSASQFRPTAPDSAAGPRHSLQPVTHNVVLDGGQGATRVCTACGSALTGSCSRWAR